MTPDPTRNDLREWVLAGALLVLVCRPFTSVVWPLFQVHGADEALRPLLDTAFSCVRTIVFWTAVIAAGACVRPLGIRIASVAPMAAPRARPRPMTP